MRTAMGCVYDAMKHRLKDCTYYQFEQYFDDWTKINVVCCGEVVGAVLQKGSEVHIAIAPDMQNKIWFRGIAREILGNVIAEHGKATTKVMDGHEIGHRMAKIFGFNETSKQDGITLYELVNKNALH